MALSVKNYTTDGSTKIFQSDFLIKSVSHVAVFLDSNTIPVSIEDYDVINNSIVFHVPPTAGQLLTIRVGSTEEEVLAAPSSIEKVAAVADSIGVIVPHTDNIGTVATDITSVNTVAADIDNVNTTATNIDNINVTADAIRGGGTTVGGQFTGGGITKPLIYTSKIVTEDTTIVNGTNALAIDTLEVADGVTLTLEDEVVMKVV